MVTLEGPVAASIPTHLPCLHSSTFQKQSLRSHSQQVRAPEIQARPTVAAGKSGTAVDMQPEACGASLILPPRAQG